jgi:hypothetical protein
VNKFVVTIGFPSLSAVRRDRVLPLRHNGSALGFNTFRAAGLEIGAHALRATAATNALDLDANIASTRIYDQRKMKPEDSPTFKVSYLIVDSLLESIRLELANPGMAMTIVRRNLAVLLLMLPLGGCAFMTHDVRIDYAFHGTVPTFSDASLATLQLGPFEDNRGNPNVRMIIHETDGYGQPTAGGWQAEKPVADIVRDAIAQGLTAARAPVVESGGSVLLTGEVQDYRYRFEEKFWSGDVFPMLTVTFRLRDSSSRETIWRRTITGSGKYHGSFMPSTESLFRSALDDLVVRVVGDASLAKALNHEAPRQ